MTLSRRSTIKAIGVVGTGSALTGTALAINEHEDDEREADEATADNEELGAIRVGHFSPDAPNVDVYIDDQQILSDVGYGDLTPYLEIVPGTYSVAITAAGDDEPVYEGTIVVDAEFYTAAALGELEGESAGTAEEGMSPASSFAPDDAPARAGPPDSATISATNATPSFCSRETIAIDPTTGLRLKRVDCFEIISEKSSVGIVQRSLIPRSPISIDDGHGSGVERGKSDGNCHFGE